MELAISPDDLYAASVALAAAGATLDDAGLVFARHAAGAVQEVGVKAVDAAVRGVRATEHAVQILGEDIDQLARALAELAHHYPHVDTTAMPRR